MEPELDHRIEVGRPPGADQGADPERQHRRVPARLLHDELEVVVRLEVDPVVPAPTELEGLSGHRLPAHEVELHHDRSASRRPEQIDVLAQRAQRRAAPGRRPRSGPGRCRSAGAGWAPPAGGGSRPRCRRAPGRRCGAARSPPPMGTASASGPPKASQVARHRLGRRALPPGVGDSRIIGAARYSLPGTDSTLPAQGLGDDGPVAGQARRRDRRRRRSRAVALAGRTRAGCGKATSGRPSTRSCPW